MDEFSGNNTTEMIQMKSGQDRLTRLFEETFADATDSFSQMTGRDMEIDRFKLNMMTSDEFSMQIIDHLEDTYFASIIKVDEHLDANIIFLIPEREGLGLYAVISGEDEDAVTDITENVVNGLGELNNILSGTFINILANYLKTSIHGSTPLNTYDMLGAILDSIALQEEFINKEVICADAMIREKHHSGHAVRLVIMSDKERLIETLEQV